MLEGLVAGLLNRFLGMYVKNFDPAQLKVGIWSGDVKLSNLELRREALDQLKLPINVVEGHLGQLTLTIPWSNLRGAPVKVFIEDVYLLASPKEEAQYNEEEEERRRQRIKMEKLDSAELLKERSQEGLSQDEQKRSQTFTASLVTKIVDNVQVTVKNIHVRYEDSISAPGHPFALGITLEEFSAVSTDGEWKPTFIQDSTKVTHKLATLGALAVYWNTDTKLMGPGRETETPDEDIMSHEDMVSQFKSMIVKAEGDISADHQFILRPVSGQAKIEMDKTGSSTAPKLKATLLFDEIGLVLDDDQYRDALMMVDLFHYFVRHQEYKKYQPKGVRPKEDPRAWLQFAANAVLSKIHERNRRWSWDFFRERRDDRKRYIELFKKRKQNQQLSPEENDDLNKLEWKLDYEDLRFWRSLARNLLRKENAQALRNKEAEQPQKQQQGWLAWAWGSKPNDQAADGTESSTENTQMTEQQRKELYEAIEWDEKAALAAEVDVPRETVKMQIEASLSTGSFTLKQNPHGDTKDLLSLHFDVFKAKGLQRPDSFLADISLGGLRVNDGTTPDSLFPEIVRVKDAPEAKTQHRLSIVELEKHEEQNDEPFFQFQLENNPLDGQGDVALTAKLKPLEIVWNPNFVVGIVDFFRPPERHMESITALMESAGATVEGLREQTRAGLEFALEEHKTINAKLDLQAPLIIIPQSVKTKTSPCLILDAGHISVNSELVDQATLKEIQAKQRSTYTDEDFRKLESLMYDRFNVKLTSTQLLIGPSIKETKKQVDTRDEELTMHIVQRINVDFVVQTSILPKAPNLTKMKVSGRLPVLHATVSDAKYKTLMRIIDVAIPKFDGEQPPQVHKSPEPKPNRPRLLSSASGRRKSERRQSAHLLPFATEQQAIILNDDELDNDKFEDAKDGTANEQLKMQQRTFEFKFGVDQLKGSLYRSDPDGKNPDQLLVELTAEDFDLEFYIRPYDMAAEVSLAAVTVDDFVDNPPAEFKSIVSSGDVEDQKEQRDLVRVKFVRVKKESPEFMSVYEGVETNIDVAVSTINLIVTRKTLLTLLDFILVTFTNNDNPTGQQQAITDTDSDLDIDVTPPSPAPGQNEAGAIKVKVDLKSIRLILNNDGIRLATLSFKHADVGVFLLGKTMRVSTKLGDLTLVDDVNQGVPETSALRQLIDIEGDDLADFRYETFDASSEQYPGYDSSIYLRAGSVKINFMEEPFRKIVDFLVKFGKMQAIYNAARQAVTNQANQLQQSTSRIKFDVIVKTPIVVFPRVVVMEQTERDLITAYLGEIYAQNKFAPLDDSEDAEIGMKLSAGIRNVRLTSLFHYQGGQSEELELIDDLDLDFNMTYAEHREGGKRPDLEVEGTMSDLNLRITQYQLKFLLEISRAVPGVFAGESDDEQIEEVEREVDNATLERARTISSDNVSTQDSQQLVDLRPELGSHGETWTKLDLVFKVQTVALELIDAPADAPVGNMDEASLGRFSLDQSQLKTRMLSNGSLEAEFVIQAFAIYDSRPKEINKFRRIMTSRNKEVQQFMASVSMSGGKERTIIAIVAVDSPRIIFALDYLFAIQRFVMTGLEVDEGSPADDESILESPEDQSDVDSMQVTYTGRQSASSETPAAKQITSGKEEESKMNIAFRVNVVDAQVILIANPLSASSEAIVLGVKQVLLSQQHALTFQISEVGMFLCRMDRFDDTRLRIIDNFSIQMSMDSSRPSLTNIHVDVEPLVLRVSLRDILLAMQIITKASEMSSPESKEHKPGPAEEKAKELRAAGLKQRTASGRGPSTLAARTRALTKSSGKSISKSTYHNDDHEAHDITEPPQRFEELTATVDGFRVILIGDLHELPILDLSVKKFTATAQNWSTNLKAEAAIDTYINIYNFAKSAWEPLLEPWQVGLGVAKDQSTGLMSVDVSSNKTFDITITTASIAVASKSFAFLTQDEDVLTKPRGAELPYRIRNYTGFSVVVLSKSSSSDEENQLSLEDGQEAPWSFENWEKMRENLLSESGTAGKVSVRLEGSGFDPLKDIRVSREGEFLYQLKPKADGVQHRLLVEVKLGDDNVKYITLRSPLLVENATQIPIELGVYDAQEGHLLKIEKIAPGDSRPAPVGAAYLKSLLVRPDSGFGYGWSSETLWWRDLLKRPTRTMVCKGEHNEPFYFQLNANFDRTHPLTA
jgi:vacuolar protein sorting-associated protein 13A/C